MMMMMMIAQNRAHLPKLAARAIQTDGQVSFGLAGWLVGSQMGKLAAMSDFAE